MSLFNTKTEYGSVTKTFHWVMAALMIIMLIVGLAMVEIPNAPDMLNFKFTDYGLHKSIGITILALVFARAGWHLYSRRPDPVESLPRIDRLGASAMHYFLYLLMIIMPLTGWLMSSAAGRPVSVFGLFTLPDLVPADKDASHIYRERHELIGYIIMASLAMHAGAALWHHFIKKDNVLKRMLPFGVFVALLLVPGISFADVTKWNVLHDKSSLSFRPKQMGTEFKGTFESFTADIAFDPANLAGSKAVVTIPITSARTGASDRDENLKAPDWFDVLKFPEARFETTSFVKKSDTSYVAEGTLTIKGVSLPVTLPFTLNIATRADGLKTATVDGAVTLDRSKFSVGVGQWTDVSIIANDVPVDVHLVAEAR
jgi:cytochrome b561